MPLHELYRMAKGNIDSKEMNNTCAADQSSAPENDFFELVWENGQISVQGQSSRARKTPTCKSFPSHCLPSHSPTNAQVKDVGYANDSANIMRMGKFEDLEPSGLNEIRMPVSSSEVDLSQDEDVMMPWLNCGMDESLQHEYNSNFLHEISGVTMNDELPASNNFTLMDKRSSNCNHQVLRDSPKNPEQGVFSKGSSAAAAIGEVETSGPKASTSQLYPPPSHQFQTSFASVRSRLVSNITENNTSHTNQHSQRGEATQIPPSSSGFSNLKMEKQDPVMSNNSSTIMNFSHFTRPVAIVKANLQNIGVTSGLSSSRSETMGKIKNQGAAATPSNPPESTEVEMRGQCQQQFDINSQVMKPDSKPLEPKSDERNATDSSKQSDLAAKDVSKIDQTSNQVLGESGCKGQEAVEKFMEPAVASSSVCSGNGAERGSHNPNPKFKRKSRDMEDSECQSEDVEEESVGVKKATLTRGGLGTKRSRSAEVHNLSERRRRDRINEKMRALQELIPNCNKADKASMLDEAIEYLKTLQLQVQMMSMGGGLYMPPLMLPTGIHHMHATHMAPFSPMQMGLGVGYGMGLPNINSGSSRFPMVQVPQMQGTHHLPVAHMSGPSSMLHGIARSNPPVMGIPSQGIPLPLANAPIYSFPGEPAMNASALGLNAACGAAGLETVYPASSSSLRDLIPNVNSKVMQHIDDGCNSRTQMSSSQCEAITGGLEPSVLVHNSGHASEVDDIGAVNPDKEDNLVLDKSC